MGHLISRAFRRLTQSGQSKEAIQQQQQQETSRYQQDDKDQTNSRPEVAVAQSIPVGQSIDSAEYAELAGEEGRPEAAKQDSCEQVEANDGDESVKEESPQQGVEKAAVKIQAYFRGHLTRKALKDAQSQSLPQANALGQSQFDEESLIKNPPSAIFESPLNLAAAASADPATGPAKSRLGSIAESAAETGPEQAGETKSKRPAVSLNLRSASSPSQLEARDELTSSVSPAPSEANASIDLGCSSPTSASVSIDIQDHNLRQTDRIASVLHHKATTTGGGDVTSVAEEPAPEEAPSKTGLESVDNEEAAAIRIQSAFRGYRSRKNSPYRSRSPKSPTSKRANANLLDFGRAIDEDAPASAQDVAELDYEPLPVSFERRQSRPREREESSPRLDSGLSLCAGEEELPDEKQGGDSVDELTSTEEGGTVVGAASALAQQTLELEEAEKLADETLDAARAAAIKSVDQAEDDEGRPLGSSVPELVGARASLASALESESSNLGATLSLNEDESAAVGQPTLDESSLVDEDKSLGGGMTTDELESEVRRLVEDLDLADDEPTVEAALTSDVQVEQQELESDDIERRDPRGQASEQRAASPGHIRRQSVQLELGGQLASVQDSAEDEQPSSPGHPINDEASKQTLAPPSPPEDEASPASGRTSPALSCSPGSSASEEESDQGGEEKARANGAQSQQRQQQTGSRNKNKRNRNKRKGKK